MTERLQTRRAALQLSGAFALSSIGAAGAQGPGAEQLVFVVGQAAGGSADIAARVTGQAMSTHTRFKVTVENRTGAGTLLAGQRVAAAMPDGNTLFLVTASFITSAILNKNLTFDAFGSMKAVAHISQIPYCIAISPKIGVDNLQSLIQLLKANPDKYSYGTAGVGTQAHFAGELFKILTGTRMQAIPYSGIAPAMTDLIRGEVPIMVTDFLSVISRLNSQEVKVLAVTGTERSKRAPDVPTFIEQGVRGIDIGAWGGLMVAAATPADKIRERNGAVNLALTDPDVQQKIDAVGGRIIGGTPDSFQVFFDTEVDTYRRIASEAKISI
jgi:tripartite-type tricarboxylate transporter receptor subunit TctC